jgi:hypothetical protein
MQMSDEDRPITGSGNPNEIMLRLPKKAEHDGEAKTFFIRVDNIEGTQTPDRFKKIVLSGVILVSQQGDVFEFELSEVWGIRME